MTLRPFCWVSTRRPDRQPLLLRSFDQALVVGDEDTEVRSQGQRGSQMDAIQRSQFGWVQGRRIVEQRLGHVDQVDAGQLLTSRREVLRMVAACSTHAFGS